MQYKGYEVVSIKDIPCGKRYISRMHARNNNRFTLEIVDFTNAGKRERVAIIAIEFILRITGYNRPNEIPDSTFMSFMKKFGGADKDTLMSNTAMKLLNEYKSFFKKSSI